MVLKFLVELDRQSQNVAHWLINCLKLFGQIFTPGQVLISIIDRQDVLPLLPDEDLIALVKLKPSILGLTFDHLPTSQLLILLSSRPQLLHSLPTSADSIISRILRDKRNLNKLMKLVKAMSAKDLVALASSRPALVADIPDEVLAVLAQR